MLTFLRQLKKYHLSTFGTNILGIVLAIFFVKSYKAQHLSLIAPLLLIKLALLAFILALIFMMKRSRTVTRLFPKVPFVLLNLAIAFFISSFFRDALGWDGLLFVLLFSFFLSETEHVLYEYARRT